ncbi:hypothetical protein ACW9UR_02595 [Halovulum sp. GXIMD14794]
MITLLAIVAGFSFGWYRAGRRGGNRLDKLQYGAGHAIAFGLLTFAILVFAARLV